MSRWLVPLGSLCLLPSILGAQDPAPAVPVRLVLHLTVDQLRPDYLSRWEGELSGGLATLLRDGVVFLAGEQDHALTDTAPGHATMLSGRTPASVGIVSNDFGVPDPRFPLLSGRGTGASPARFLGTTLHDWLRAVDPETRVLSISRKDRGAILPIGRAKVPVFWWARGVFTTSRWYADSLPTWLQQWNARDPVEQLRGTSWTLLRDPASYPEVDDRPFEAGGSDRTFPHLLPDDWTMAAGEIENRPVIDSLTLDAAWQGVQALGLGTRDGVDLLAISLSALDNIGHRWGPGSREVHDQVLRLDRLLGQFFDSLATQLPLEQVIVSLSADHGVQEFPEAGEGGRLAFSPVARALNSRVRERWAIDLGATAQDGLIVADRAALVARGMNVDSLEDALSREVLALPGVTRVFTPRSLAAAPSDDPTAGLWRHSIPASVEWLVAAELADHWMWNSSRTSTSHGTTALVNRRVPIIFRVPGLAPARPSRVIRTVDIAPTLAALLGIVPTEPLDGVPLPELVGSRRPR